MAQQVLRRLYNWILPPERPPDYVVVPVQGEGYNDLSRLYEMLRDEGVDCHLEFRQAGAGLTGGSSYTALMVARTDADRAHELITRDRADRPDWTKPDFSATEPE
jgi:hypothetical protein